MNIRLKDIVKRFGTLEAVSHVSLDIQDGELFTLLGPSGCGKTTILRLIGGFHKPDRGEIYFGDREVSAIPPYERNIGMVFQNYALWPHMTNFDNVAYVLKIKKVPAKESAEKVNRALSLVNLTGLEKRYPGQLSGGQQQRVALARALVLNPDVLLPTSPPTWMPRYASRCAPKSRLKKSGHHLICDLCQKRPDLSDWVRRPRCLDPADCSPDLYQRLENSGRFHGINNLIAVGEGDQGRERLDGRGDPLRSHQVPL
jgi:ABC-type ATPase involved in cell division